MITRDEIRELAAFQADETKGACALSFYFQPDPPQDRSHRSQAIVAKEVVKQALKSSGGAGQERIAARRSRPRARSGRQSARAAGESGFCVLSAEFLEGVRSSAAARSHTDLSPIPFSPETARRLAGRAADSLGRYR